MRPLAVPGMLTDDGSCRVVLSAKSLPLPAAPSQDFVEVSFRRIMSHLSGNGRSLSAVALLLAWFVSFVAAANPSLHHWFHEDDHAASHECVVTVLQQGQGEISTTIVVEVPIFSGVPPRGLPYESFSVAHDTKLYPERGPPSLS